MRIKHPNPFEQTGKTFELIRKCMEDGVFYEEYGQVALEIMSTIQGKATYTLKNASQTIEIFHSLDDVHNYFDLAFTMHHDKISQEQKVN